MKTERLSWGTIYVIENTGEIRFSKNVLNSRGVLESPALADIDNDGNLEIATSFLDSSGAYIYDHNGNVLPNWPQFSGGTSLASSIFANVDEDSDIELLKTAGTEVWGWDTNGNTVLEFPKLTEYHATASASVFDLDNDGLSEIIASSDNDYDMRSGKFKNRGSIYVWETNSSFSEETQEWPMFHHDAAHTGCYNC